MVWEIVPLHKDYIPPVRSTKGAAGYDFFSYYETEIPSGGFSMIPLGFKQRLPEGYFLKLESRSSYALRGIIILGGIIDADFRFQIMTLVHNLSDVPFKINKGDRICQGIILKYHVIPLVHVTALEPSTRAEGFGSSGR